MRIAIILVFLSMLPISAVFGEIEDRTLPPQSVRASWDELDKVNFASWVIKSISYGGKCGDGGSKVFSLNTTSGKTFDLLATNPAYWSEEDIKLRRQVFYLIYDKKFYRVGIKTKGESDLLAMLEAARKKLADKPTAELTLYRGLIARIRNRILPK